MQPSAPQLSAAPLLLPAAAARCCRLPPHPPSYPPAYALPCPPLQRLGLDAELPKLSVIHVAGTKGKGSTCAMVERMLRQAGYRTGLFTSPHLIDVRERIRINGCVCGCCMVGLVRLDE